MSNVLYHALNCVCTVLPSGDGTIPYGYGFFHIVYATGSMYMAMMLLSWQLVAPPAALSISAGWFAVWVKMANLWATALVYLLTMVAPVVSNVISQ